MKAKILGVRFLHEGWTKFGLVHVRLADGTEAEREIGHHGDSVGVLPYDPESRVALLVLELRVPALYVAGDQAHPEAPAGLIEDGTPEENARRNVEEEVGLRLSELEPIGVTWSYAGISTERIHLYLARYAATDRAKAGGGRTREHHGPGNTACRPRGHGGPGRARRSQESDARPHSPPVPPHPVRGVGARSSSPTPVSSSR